MESLVSEEIYAWNTVVVVNTLIDVQNRTIIDNPVQNSGWKRIYCPVLHLCNALLNCFLLCFNLLLINDCFFPSESSDVAVDVFNKQGLLPYLVSSLKTDIYPKTVAIPAGEVLLFFKAHCNVFKEWAALMSFWSTSFLKHGGCFCQRCSIIKIPLKRRLPVFYFK